MEYGLIGKKLSHSISPFIHSLLGNNHYELLELEEDELDLFFKKRVFKGINVTIPYKEKVLKYIDELDDTAKSTKNVNTIINKNGKLIGYNTDYYGLKQSINLLNISLENKTCMILGTGGASKTIQALLKKEKAKKVFIVSRTPSKNQISYAEIDKYDINILFNATPIGLYPNNYDKVINLLGFKNLEAVFDLIYNPLNTHLVLEAKENKIKASGGLTMLIEQARYADKLFFDREDLMKIDYRQIYQRLQNIVFIGMPYSGKTTISKRIAEELNYEFIDLDNEFMKKNNINIEDYFKKYGEEEFRKIEHEICFLFAKKNHIVISTGGGIIENKENILALKQNGIIIYVQRDYDKINFDLSRPLAKNIEEYKILLNKRKKLYEKYANIIVYNNSDIDDCVNDILKKINALEIY